MSFQIIIVNKSIKNQLHIIVRVLEVNLLSPGLQTYRRSCYLLHLLCKATPQPEAAHQKFFAMWRWSITIIWKYVKNNIYILLLWTSVIWYLMPSSSRIHKYRSRYPDNVFVLISFVLCTACLTEPVWSKPFPHVNQRDVIRVKKDFQFDFGLFSLPTSCLFTWFSRYIFTGSFVVLTFVHK